MVSQIVAPLTPEERAAFKSALSEASLTAPTWFGPSTWVQHAPFMGFLVEALRPKVAVELGSHFGYSFFVMCQIVSAYGIGAQCFAVDTWEGDEHAGFYSSDVYKLVRQHCDEHYSDFAQLYRMRFDQALSNFDDNSIDLLHIDGRHYYEDVREDYLSWAPKLSRRSIVLFHDTQVKERGFGVHQLWTELSALYPSFEFYHGHGLGVLAFGEDIREDFAWISDAQNSPKLASAIRVAYQILGGRLEEPARIERRRIKGTKFQRWQRKVARFFSN